MPWGYVCIYACILHIERSHTRSLQKSGFFSCWRQGSCFKPFGCILLCSSRTTGSKDSACNHCKHHSENLQAPNQQCKPTGPCFEPHMKLVYQLYTIYQTWAHTSSQHPNGKKSVRVLGSAPGPRNYVLSSPRPRFDVQVKHLQEALRKVVKDGDSA